MRQGGKIAIAVAASVGLLTTGCAPALQVETVAAPAKSLVTIEAPFLGQQDVDFAEPIVVASPGGRLSEVSVVNPAGEPIAGQLIDGGTRWQSAEGSLDFSTAYSMTATAVDRYGAPNSVSGSFTTLAPKDILEYSVYPRDGATFGVGMPITVKFNNAVTDKAAVESRLTVTTDQAIEGAWSWNGDKSVTYRPREYWPANTAISVALNLRGVESSEDIYGVESSTVSYRTGSALISVVDARTHQMTVRRNGEVIRTLPITTGKPGWETRSGIKVIMSKERSVVMDAGTLGVSEEDEEYYRLDVPFAMRITNSGEFVHAAPWSVESQGRDNVSHGCVGMSLGNAEWFFNNSQIGDILQVVGTGRSQDLGNGITVWNESWEQWLEGSALAGAQPA